MKRSLALSILIFIFFSEGRAQTQTVTSGGATLAVNFSGTGCVYSWVNDNPGIRHAEGGTWNIGSFSAINNGAALVTATTTAPPVASQNAYFSSSDNPDPVTVANTQTHAAVASIAVGAAPNSFGNFTDASVCNGTPIKFTITVNPSSVIIPSMTSSIATGTISACAGSASTYVQKFTVSGSDLSANIYAAAPAGFEMSLGENGGFGNSVTLVQSGGAVNSTTVYIRSAAAAAPGKLVGNVTLTSTGVTSQMVKVTATVHPLPAVNKISNQNIYNGDLTTAVNFTGTAGTYTWVNNTPGIGLAASGSGNITPFISVNNGNSPVTATITATPTSAEIVYIINSANNAALALNTVTGTIIASIPVGTGPFGILQNLDGSKVYVANTNSNDVSVISTATNTVVATIAVGLKPFCIAERPDGSIIYVGNSGFNGNGYTISAINAATGLVTATIPIAAPPMDIAVSPDGSTLYIAGGTAHDVVAINAKTYAATATIPVFTYAPVLSMSPDGSRLYLPNLLGNSVVVINTATSSVITSVLVGGGPIAITVSSDGSRVYVANALDYTVSVIDTQTNAVIATIPVGSDPRSVALSPDGSQLFVENLGGDSFSVINTATNKVTATLKVNVTPISLGNIIINGPGCSGAPVTFTITVNPTSQTAKIIKSAAKGSISACEGMASSSPKIQRFTVSGSGLSADITATAPARFEVSLATGSGYGVSVTLKQSAGNVSNSTVYVRSAASAPSGNLNGDVALTSSGTTSQYVAVAGLVGGTPTVNSVPNQTLVSGITTTAVNFTGTATAFNWINDTPGIGLATGGVGNILSFVTTNNGNAPITATITVTPVPPGKAYIASITSNSLTVINTATDLPIATISVGDAPFGVSVSPDGSHVYVTNQNSNNVSVVNTTTNTVEASINVGLTPAGVVVSPDGSKVYVANGSGTISVISTATNLVTSTINVGSFLSGIAISPDGGTLYVANGNLMVVNALTGVVIANIFTGLNPVGVVVSPDGSRVYVANSGSNTVAMVNSATNAIIATIPVGLGPSSLSVSPDGGHLYVSDSGNNEVSVINTSNNTVIATIPIDSQPYGLSVTPDGNRVFVSEVNANSVSVISTINNAVVTKIQVGLNPNSLGNFIAQGSSCSGASITFTITVEPAARSINATGTLSPLTTTYGTPSLSTSFNVSGTSLLAGILVTPPRGFEVSIDNINFTNTVTVGTPGNIANTQVYIRLAASAPVGNYSGDIVLTSKGAADVNVLTANNVVNPAPLVITATDVTKTFGSVLTGGTHTNFSISVAGLQNFETIVGVTITYGPGAAATDPPGIYKGSVIASLPVGGSFTASNYTITYNPGNIIVNPAPTIKATGTLPALNTTYGSPSPSAIFSVSGADVSTGVLITPPPGFEVSSDNINFSSTVTVIVGGTGTNASVTVYIRLAAITPVGSYSGNIMLSSAGVTAINIIMPASTVNKALLTITADNQSKFYGGVNPVLTATYTGFVNNETPANLATLPILITAATTNSPVGQYPITISGAMSPNYAIVPVPGILTINPILPSIVIPNTFTPNGDGINDKWDIKYLDVYANCSVDVFSRYGQKVYSSIGYGIPWNGTYNGAALPTGTYYYIINLKNGFKSLSGFVAILR